MRTMRGGNHKVLDVNGNAITATAHIGHRNPFRYRGYFYDIANAICVGMSMIPVPGARVVSGITAGMIFIVDLFS